SALLKQLQSINGVVTNNPVVPILENFLFEIEPGKGSYDVRYSDLEIRHYYSEFAKRAWKAGLRYGSCYIGMGLKDYYQHQNLWTNKADCCDVIGNVSSFKKTSQSVAWEERLKHSPYKEAAKIAMSDDKFYSEEFDPQLNHYVEPHGESTL
ncbi:MAG: hypothetical protein EOP06_22040, partial [Proteobacteria bacterium]